MNGSTQTAAMLGTPLIGRRSFRPHVSSDPRRSARPRPVRTQALLNFFNIGKKVAKVDQASKLLELVSDTQLGSDTPPELKVEILEAVEQLCALQGETATTGPDLSATWKMAWTTEKVPGGQLSW